jgi:hypothetical protein
LFHCACGSPDAIGEYLAFQRTTAAVFAQPSLCLPRVAVRIPDAPILDVELRSFASIRGPKHDVADDAAGLDFLVRLCDLSAFVARRCCVEAGPLQARRSGRLRPVAVDLVRL